MDSSCQIRDYCIEDFDALSNLWELTGVGGSERGDDHEVIEKTLANGGRLFVMSSIDGQLIGSSWLSNDARRIYIHHFVIHPDFQGRGLSKALLEKSLDYCRELELQVKLEVLGNNYKALDLYKKYGFSELESYGVLIIRETGKKKP